MLLSFILRYFVFQDILNNYTVSKRGSHAYPGHTAKNEHFPCLKVEQSQTSSSNITNILFSDWMEIPTVSYIIRQSDTFNRQSKSQSASFFLSSAEAESRFTGAPKPLSERRRMCLPPPPGFKYSAQSRCTDNLNQPIWHKGTISFMVNQLQMSKVWV